MLYRLRLLINARLRLLQRLRLRLQLLRLLLIQRRLLPTHVQRRLLRSSQRLLSSQLPLYRRLLLYIVYECTIVDLVHLV